MDEINKEPPNALNVKNISQPSSSSCLILLSVSHVWRWGTCVCNAKFPNTSKNWCTPSPPPPQSECPHPLFASVLGAPLASLHVNSLPPLLCTPCYAHRYRCLIVIASGSMVTTVQGLPNSMRGQDGFREQGRERGWVRERGWDK